MKKEFYRVGLITGLYWAAGASFLFASVSAIALDGGGRDAQAPVPAARPPEQVTVTGIRPSHTTSDYWIEDAYEQIQPLGPRFAKGLIVWNNSVDANGKGATVPPPRFMEGFAARGWDVIRIQRNWRLGDPNGGRGIGELAANRSGLVEAVSAELRQANADGYKRVILAGQGIGAALALEAAVANPGLYGVIALAPNIGFVAGAGLGGQSGRGSGPSSPGDYNGTVNQSNADWTAEILQRFRPLRAALVFPKGDEQVPGLERGAKARAVLASRTDLAYQLVDETYPIYGHNGVYQGAFLPAAACTAAIMEPQFTPKPGEIKCGHDEVPALLTLMGVKAATGHSWFGYSSTGTETYLELPSDGAAKVKLALGRGALWNQPSSIREYSVERTADSVLFQREGQGTVTGLWTGGVLRMTFDNPDGTRSAAQMAPID